MPVGQPYIVMRSACSSLHWLALLCGVSVHGILLGSAAALVTTGAVQAQTTDSFSHLTELPAGRDLLAVDTAQPAIPSAQEIIQDLPSVFHLSRHQRGEINGLRYVLFPDGTGTVMQADQLRAALYRIACEKGVSCIVVGADGSSTRIRAINGPEPDLPSAPSAEGLARYLSEWILAGTGTPPAPSAAPEPPVAVALSPEPADTSDPSEVNVGAPEPVASTASLPVAASVQIPESLETSKQTENDIDVAVTPRALQSSEPAHLPCVIEDPDVDCSAPQLEKLRIIEAPQRQAKIAPSSPQLSRQGSPVDKPSRQPAAAAEEQTFFQRIKLACSITGSVTLRYVNHNTGSERFGKPRTSLGCGAQLSEKLTLRFSVIGYLDRHEKSPYDAEFTYAISYKATDKITLGYSNYSGRFNSSEGSFSDSLRSGALRASYRLPKIRLPNEKTVGCSTSANLLDLSKSSLNLFCSYAVTDRLRISGTAYTYFSGAQDPWDPDFAYVASYKINEDWSITYSNYANNRFFWNSSSTPGEGIWGGTVSVAYKFKF